MAGFGSIQNFFHGHAILSSTFSVLNGPICIPVTRKNLVQALLEDVAVVVDFALLVLGLAILNDSHETEVARTCEQWISRAERRVPTYRFISLR